MSWGIGLKNRGGGLDQDRKEELRRVRLARWKQAMEDPAFLEDLLDVEAAFSVADAEALENR